MSFTLLTNTHIPELNATVKLYTHDKTGARLLSVLNDDENKVFGITFRTPPQTSNGIAHIMEHSVLCGSRKYPVKEPFIELAKGSLNTFLNAFTYPDKTCYPVASQNLQDFYNLIDVYLDAVFYPLIPEHTLRQEGWHYELDSPDAPLTFKGVVFNEMKGALSSPDDLLGEVSQQSLYPDTPYGLNSGGDPAVIPDLTYAEFKAFHETYYHPSNSYIYFCGDDPEDERLRLMDKWLEAFERKDAQSSLPLQPRWTEPKLVVKPYDSGDSPDAKAYITVNWLLDEPTDIEATMGLSILSHVLLATPASPLKKALTDSGLGEDVTGGYTEDLRQGYFSAGMQGVETANLPKVQGVIEKTLERLAREGIDPDTVAASLNTIEFRLREQNTGRFPRGLFLMLNALSTWLYGGDPIAAIAFEKPLSAIKDKAAAGRYFEGLIEKYLLANPHRTTIHLVPDPEEGKRIAEAETARLEKARAAMSPADLQKVIETAAELKLRQETPDSPEALATIPSLALEDLERENKLIPREVRTLGATRVLFHDLFTNGIVYLNLGFDLHGLPADLLPFMGLFGRALLQMGTATQDYVQLTQRIGRETGGIGSGTLTSTIRESSDSALWFFLSGKAVTSQAGELLAILKDVLLTANLDNRERFKQIALEEKAGAESGLIPGGHAVVNRRLRARFSEADWVAEQINGLDNLFFVRKLVEEIEKDWPAVLEKLETVRRLLINRKAMIVNVTLDADSFAAFSPQLATFIDALPAREFEPSAFIRESVIKSAEGLTIPAQVNYVGKGANLFKLGYEPHGSINVIHNYLGTTWLWEKVRVQGGAYGGMSAFDPNSGVWTYLSYRDPNLLSTLDNYDATAKFLRDLDLSREELAKSIIGTIGDFDAYLLPDAKGYTSMVRYLTHYTDEERQRIREEVLGTTVADFKSFARVLEEVARQGEVVVMGSAEAIQKANKGKEGWLEVKKVL
ncbi:MAG: insulinase family protein [Chloroflexota bacterium]